MKVHSIKQGFPIDVTVLEILSLVSQEATAAGMDYMLVGATARDILLTHVFGIEAKRATHDIDFAVAVENWDRFEQIKAQLLARGCFNVSERLQQRLYFKGADGASTYPLDLVPFGGVTNAANEIAWPPDMKIVMNVAGYQEVLSAAEKVELGKGVVAKVASLPGLAVLKLVAWSDRGTVNPKDAHDLYHLLTTYADAGNFDRLYDEEFPILEATEHDPEMAGACLLGKDIKLLVTPETFQILKGILLDTYEKLALEMVRSIRNKDNGQTIVEAKLHQFKIGLGIQE